MVIISLLNQKGGVGKTSTCHHLAGTLAKLGRRVLLVDNDPQASLTQGLLGPVATRAIPPGATIAALYGETAMFPEQVIRPTHVGGIDLVPGSRVAFQYNLPDPRRVDESVRRCLADFLPGLDYDFVLVDCPPTLGLCAWAALVASTHLLVPLQPEDYGAQGIADVQDFLERAQAARPGLSLLGYLVTMFAAKRAIHRTYLETLRENYAADVLATIIPEATEFPEAIAKRLPAEQYKPKGVGAKVFRALAAEVQGRVLRGATPGQGEAA